MGWKPMSWNLGDVVDEPTKELPAIAYFDVDKKPGTSAGSDENRCWYPSWRPDKDLNQFKLVLDKYKDWWMQGARAWSNSDPPNPSPPTHYSRFKEMGWNHTAEALKAIRKAVEDD